MTGSTLSKLIRAANQIAAEFATQQPGNAVAATHDHLWHFWDPRMVSNIIAHADIGGEGLRPDALEAVRRLKSPVEPEPQTKATTFGADAKGEVPADAG